jgi:formate-dependent nitrite reductase membrane component NrfD
MSPDIHIPQWAWYYIALYFFIAGTAAGAYFIGALDVLFGDDTQQEISRAAYYITFPLLLLVPIPLIADLGRPERFWHLFFYIKEGIPYINLQSPMSVGSWVLLLFSFFALLSFLDNLVVDKRITCVPFARLYNRIPRKVYAIAGSLAGFFIAGYTGVLLNVTAIPFWAATSPLLGPLFIVSGASGGAAAITLFMIWDKTDSSDAFHKLERFDRMVKLTELLLLAMMLIFAGKHAAVLISPLFVVLFWIGAVCLGIVLPLWFYSKNRTLCVQPGNLILTSSLALTGGALLRICLLQAGQL